MKMIKFIVFCILKEKITKKSNFFENKKRKSEINIVYLFIEG